MLHPRRPALAASLLLCAALSGCASVEFTRQTETSGTFRSTGLSLTLFAVDLPKGALMIARENASDANLANMQVTDTTVFPYLGWFDWVLDIISVRWARIEGTWGTSGR